MSSGKENITQELLVRLKKNDVQAFDQIYEWYFHKLFAFISRILKDDLEAEDIVQGIFIKIWESRNKFEDFKSLNSYVFTVAYHSSISVIRKRSVDKKYQEYLKNFSDIHSAPDSISELEFYELNSQVQKLIDRLPERQKQVFQMHREKGLSYPEIAKQLGISKNTVEVHMVKALRYLRQNIDQSLFVNFLFICLFL
ncbi:MAG: RNA polymerase sigma-70 factor [Mangrovibacterium sp.]